MCGASEQQKDTYQEQSDLFKQMSQQSASVFGSASNVFTDLNSALAPIVAAGPNQKGFSAAEDAALHSQSITATGQGYKNAKQALGEINSARGGGTTALPGGAVMGENEQLAASAANEGASESNQIEQSNWATGRQNFFNAIQPLESSTNVFNPATGAGEGATGAGSAASSTANEISQANNSWVGAVTGMLGGIASNLVAPGSSLLGGIAKGSSAGKSVENPG